MWRDWTEYIWRQIFWQPQLGGGNDPSTSQTQSITAIKLDRNAKFYHKPYARWSASSDWFLLIMHNFVLWRPNDDWCRWYRQWQKRWSFCYFSKQQRRCSENKHENCRPLTQGWSTLPCIETISLKRRCVLVHGSPKVSCYTSRVSKMSFRDKSLFLSPNRILYVWIYWLVFWCYESSVLTTTSI